MPKAEVSGSTESKSLRVLLTHFSILEKLPNISETHFITTIPHNNVVPVKIICGNLVQDLIYN